MNWKGFERNRLWPYRDKIPAFAWRDLGGTHKISVSKAGVWAEVRTKHVENMSPGTTVTIAASAATMQPRVFSQ
jgi:hypothetical protein